LLNVYRCNLKGWWELVGRRRITWNTSVKFGDIQVRVSVCVVDCSGTLSLSLSLSHFSGAFTELRKINLVSSCQSSRPAIERIFMTLYSSIFRKSVDKIQV
jgi:hypothetical protein